MATRKRAKRKTKPKPKRKKTLVTKATTRRKTKTVRKKPAKKALIRHASSKKVKPTANAAVKATAAGSAAQPVAATPTRSPSARPALPGERIGIVTHYYSHLSVATLRLESGTLRVGDIIHIRGHTTDLSQRVESLEVNHASATEVGPSEDFGLKVDGHVREHDVVYRVRP
jgi:translation elongation factor EF-Tu-like GTPase